MYRNTLFLIILEYFNSCCSIIKTACRFGIEMEELYELIPQWDGCRDGLQNADDYKECYKQIFGMDYPHDNNNY